MTPENYPRRGDSIFPATNKFTTRIPDLEGEWVAYADSYKQAADILAAQTSASDQLLEPTIFLYRHLLELRLKSIIALGFVAEEDGNAREKLKELVRKHDLRWLVSGCRALCESHGIFGSGIRVKDMFAASEKCIGEVADIDPGSYSFRYPIDRKLQASIRRPFNLSADHVRQIVGKLDNLLKLLQQQMEAKVDGFEGIDDTDAENERCRKEYFGIDEMEADQESEE